jgi:hypothetical protein
MAFISAVCMVFNMVAMPIFQNELFVQHDPIIAVGWVMLGGFGLVLIFNIAYVTRIIILFHAPGSQKQNHRGSEPFGSGMLALGIVCIILLAGAKVMVDEIGREVLLGWETTGEWVILYVCLTTQLTFSVIATTRLALWHQPDRA